MPSEQQGGADMPKKYGFDSEDQSAGLDYNSDVFHFHDDPVSTGSSSIPSPDFHVAQVSDLQASHQEGSMGLGNDIIIFDAVSFAKGGGGGTGGSGGGGGTVSQYLSGAGNGDAGYDIL